MSRQHSNSTVLYCNLMIQAIKLKNDENIKDGNSRKIVVVVPGNMVETVKQMIDKMLPDEKDNIILRTLVPNFSKVYIVEDQVSTVTYEQFKNIKPICER